MEIKETSESKEQDITSTLLGDVLLHILSFLDMASAFQATQVLKGRKHLWSHMNVLQFKEETFEDCPELSSRGSFEEFVQAVLDIRKPGNIDTFDISCTSENTDLIFSWISSSVLNHHVQHLGIVFRTDSFNVLPETVFKCESLKSLRIGTTGWGGRQGLRIPLADDYNGLTLLELNDCQFWDAHGDHEVYSPLVLNFPVLEELRLANCELVEEFTIFAPKLKIFKFSQHYDQVMGWHIRLHMPCLKLFVCDDYTDSEQKFFFLCDLLDLRKSQIRTYTGHYDEYIEDYADPAFRLLQHMHNANELDLGGELIDIISQSSQINDWPNNFPIARYNLCSLKLTMMRTEQSANTLFYILSASPNIKYLEVELKEVPADFAYLVDSQSIGQPAKEDLGSQSIGQSVEEVNDLDSQSMGQPTEEDANSQSMVVSLLDYCNMERLEVIQIRAVKYLWYDMDFTSVLMTISENLQQLIVHINSEDYSEDLCNAILAYLNEHKRESQ